MRLGQLARKLAIRPSQIVDYLSTIEVFPEEGSNARLSDEVTGRVIMYFAPERLNEILTKEETPEPVIVSPPVEEQPVQSTIVEAAPEVESGQSPVAELSEEKPEVEVIKAPKVELTGLKVLGKIDLPEPRKKSPPVSESAEGVEVVKSEAPITGKKPVKTERKEKISRGKENYNPRPARNPIAEQREKIAREEEERRKAKAERDKEKRTQYYLQRVKTGQPTKSVKIVSEPTETYELKEVKPAPKTWLGKFLRWLNT
jgi:hypothetical protein